MNDDRVSQALKSLPREQAGLGFTAGVLRRIEAPPRLLPARWITATAMAAVLILAVGFGWREWRHHQAAENLQVLLAEKQELEAELDALRRLTAEARPVVYLGSDSQVDLVLDLGRFQRQGGFGSNLPASNATPAEDGPAVALEARPRNAAPQARPRQAIQEEQTVRPLRVVY